MQKHTYIHIHTRTYTYIHVTCTYIHKHLLHIHIHTYTYIHIHTHTYIHTYTSRHIHLHEFTYIYIHIYKHTHIQTYKHTDIHTLHYVTLHYITYRDTHTHTGLVLRFEAGSKGSAPRSPSWGRKGRINRIQNYVNWNTVQHWTGTEINSSDCFGAGTHTQTHSLQSKKILGLSEQFPSMNAHLLFAFRSSSSMRCWLQINVWDESSICSLVQGPGRCGIKEEIVDNHSISIV